MIPKISAYKDTNVSANKTRFEIEEMLETKFKVTTTLWKKEDPENTYFAFQYKTKHSDKPITYKVQVPFIEKSRRAEERNKHSKIISTYDEKRSYRFFFHIFKAMMINTEIGMDFEQIMANYMVVGKLEDGTPVNVLEKVTELIVNPERKVLELF